jgi:CO dehydrogenase/acetyl-CoA synthase gamma subunit (corrinoid Fe-S protein)
MNPLDIYKRLPRINCGECPAKTCMSFAVKLSKKEIALSECPKLTEQTKKEIEALLSAADTADWKEKRVWG